MEIYGNIWKYMEIYGNIWKNGGSWEPQEKIGSRMNGAHLMGVKRPDTFGAWKDGLMKFYEPSTGTSMNTWGWSKHVKIHEADEHPQPTTTAYVTMLMWTRWDQGVDLRIAILSQRFVWIHMTELTCMHLECQVMHTAILISMQKAKATRFIRMASRREPPAPRELDREETSGRTWPKQSRLGSNLAVLGLKSGAHFGPTWGLTCAELGPVGSNLGPSWAQLRPNMAQHGRVWAQVKLKVAQCGQSNIALHEPASKPNKRWKQP